MELNVTIIAIIRAFLLGCVDSFKGGISLFYIDKKINEKVEYERARLAFRKRSDQRSSKSQIKDGKVLKRIIQCCGLNGGVFLTSILIFDYALLPSLKFILVKTLGQSPMTNTVWNWSHHAVTLIFGSLWVLPLFLLSKVVNTLWFQDIADSAFWCTTGKAEFFSRISKLCADTLFSVIIQSLFLVQAVIIGFFPVAHVGQLLSVIHISMLYSLYAFEYKWCKIGWELHRRLLFIENNWPYFIGFGLPLAVVTSLPESYFVSACVFSILFPLFIISANDANPVTNSCDFPLQLFSVVIALSNTICSRTLKRTGSKKVQHQPQYYTVPASTNPKHRSGHN